MASNCPKIKSKQCKVCGDHALYTYFGVTCCEACKMFFKRYGENYRSKLPCKFEGECEINLLTRHACTACRLRKCLDSGMQVEKIRHGLVGKNSTKKTSFKLQNNKIALLLPTNSLLSSDRSSLSKDQWTLINNLIQAYNLEKLLSLTERVTDQQNCRDVAVTTDLNRPLMQEFLISFYQEAGHTCRINLDFQALSYADRSVLLHTAIDNITCLGGIFVSATKKMLDHKDLADYLHLVYGSMAIAYHRWATTYVYDDVAVFKIALALFSLSTLSRTYQPTVTDEYVDVKSVLEIEHKYAAVLWQYLLYRHSFREAVQQYVRIIRWFLAMTVFMYYARCAQTHVSNVESLIEETEVNLIMDDVDKLVDTDHSS